MYGIRKHTFLSLKKFQTTTNWSCFFRYTYRMGHILSDGSYVWSKVFSFKSSPYPGQDSLQRVIIFGDMGKVCMLSLTILATCAFISATRKSILLLVCSSQIMHNLCLINTRSSFMEENIPYDLCIR